jgi:hypothetical protein
VYTVSVPRVAVMAVALKFPVIVVEPGMIVPATRLLPKFWKVPLLEEPIGPDVAIDGHVGDAVEEITADVVHNRH